MRLRTLLILLTIAAMLIIVPANEAIFRWIGLDATLRGEELRFGTGTNLTVNESNTGIDGSDAVDPGIESITSTNSAKDNSDSTKEDEQDIRADAPPMIAAEQIESVGSGRNPGDTLVFDRVFKFTGNNELSDDGANQDTKTEFELFQNTPNPFNASTRIAFIVPEAGEISLDLYNILGQKVGEIYHGYVDAGYSEFGVNKSIHNLASGIYFYRLSFDSLSLVRKMAILR